MDTIAEEIIIRHTLPLDNNNSSDHSGRSGTSEAEMQHGTDKESEIEFSRNVDRKRIFKEALQKSFPLCKGSN